MELNNVGEFPINGLSKQDILDDLETVCSHNKKDKSGKILNSICTSPAEISKVVFSQYLDLNSGDKRIFPGIIEIENKVIKMIGEILDSVQTYGIITSGGTEANILALYAAKKNI